MPPSRWVILAYRLPREPSAPRLAVGRRLKRLGVAQLLDGLVALPLDSRTREQLEWVADEIADAGGQASVWLAEPTTASQARELAEGLRRAVAEQYRTVIEDAEAAAAEPLAKHRRTLSWLRRELARIQRRDHFPPGEGEEARAAVEALAAALEREAAR